MSRARSITIKLCGGFSPSDEILEKQKTRQADLDEAKQNAVEKDSLGSKVNEGSEDDNPVSSITELSSLRPDSEDRNSACDKLEADGKAKRQCVSVILAGQHLHL